MKAAARRASRTDIRSMGSSLPDDLVHNVLGRLPLKDVMRFRCVSKEWNDLLMSWEFSHSFCRMPGKLVPLYLDDRALTIYNSSTNSWLQCDLHHVSSLKYHQFQLVASGGGFYSFVFLDPRSADGEGETYIYDSRLRSWRLGCKLPSSIRRLDGFAEPYMLYSGYKSQCVTKEGKFYWLVSQTEGPTLDLVYIYDVNLDRWSYVFCRVSNQRTTLGISDERTTFVRCMEHKGEILVVGKRGRRLSKKPFCYFEILDTGSSNLDSMEARRLYLQEKAMPMNGVLDVIAPLQIEGTQELKLSWCVGARDEVFYLLEAQSFDLSRDPSPAGFRDDFPLSSPMVRYAGVDDSWTLLCNWKILHDRYVSLKPCASHGVWAFQPSLVSPGAFEGAIKHPHASNDEEFDFSEVVFENV
ncbi:hypothetical protein Mapa_004016 [Marchantia paleacea]|nr:hypothetical protein Mapa_004016 [Marchantia paleacea]